MAKYVVDSSVPSYSRAWGLDLGNKYVEANSESEAKRLAAITAGIPAAAISVQFIAPGLESVLSGGLQPLSANQNLTPKMTPAQEDRTSAREVSSGASSAFGTDPSNIEGYYSSAPRPDDKSFTSMVASIDPNYDPTGGAYSTFKPGSNFSVGNLGGIDPAAYAPLGGAGFDSNRLNGGASPVGYDAAPGVYSGMYGETFDPDLPVIPNPVSADLRNQLDFANSQAFTNATIDQDELDRLDAERAARESQEKFDEEQERKKQASLLNDPVRSWDAKLQDITLSYDAKGNVSVNLPVDMWRNASRKVGTVDQKIGREEIEDAIRKIAELGGRDNLDRSVSNMLQQARNYYSSTPRGGNAWNRSIDGGLIDGKLLADDAFKATWGSLADEVLGAREADVTGQIPDAWASNPDGFNSYSEKQKDDIRNNNLGSHQEVQNFYSAEQAKQFDAGADAEALYDVGKDVGRDTDLPTFTTKGFGTDIDPFYGETVDPNALGTGQLGPDQAGPYDQTLPVVPPPPVFGPEPPPAAAGSFPVLSSQELINDPQGYLTAAGQRLAFRNVYGDAATGVGPLASYLQRQTFPLTNAYRAASFANMGREQAGGVAPQVSFEDFLRTTRNQPSGLSGTYGQALQDVGYLRGLGGSQVPVGLEGVFNPEQAANTRDARNLLAAAQRGKYSGLVSSAFRRPTEDDLFSDYVLARQDASAAGTAPQNFLNFAASRYGL